MKAIAIARRILQQLTRDKRTLMLLLVAPLVMLTLISFLFDSYGTNQSVALVNAPLQYQQQLEAADIKVTRCSEAEADRLLQQGEVDAVVDLVNDRLTVQLDGSSSAAAQVLNKLELARQKSSTVYSVDYRTDVTYVNGYDGLSMFDQFGSVLIGILVFFLVFLVAGISFVQERTSGTLEKLLSTPVKRWEIVLGYVLGFGVITCLQATLLALYVVYVLRVMLAGSIWLVLLLTLLSALSALTLGVLLSTIANSEFQMVQFIPIIVVPQIFLSGLFELQGFWKLLSYATPIYYVAHGLQQVMLKGGGLSDIWVEVVALLGFSLLFFTLNVLLLKKQRRV